MTQQQEDIYANDRMDLIIPYGKIGEVYYQQIIAPYTPTILNDQFAVIHVPMRSNAILGNIQFVYSLVPNLYVPLDTTSLEVSGILQTQNQPGLQLHGANILLGFVDTGINYTHPAFLTATGQTRIVEIWDQTLPSPAGDGPFGYGTVYTAEQIQEALGREDPLSLVPVSDPQGHGTFVTGVAAGSENRQQEFIGAADEAQIAVVKLKEAKQPLQDFYFYSGEGPVYQENDIMAGIQYLVELADRLQLPLVLCLALGSNQGDHMGYTPLDISLQNLGTVPGIASVTAAGNEAGKAHHYFGSITGNTESASVEILVPDGCKGFFVELWCFPPELFSVGFRSPGGETIPRIPVSLNQEQRITFVLERTVIYVNYEVVQATTGSQLILIRMLDPTPGIWTLQVYRAFPSPPDFHIWLPITGFSTSDVTFLEPDPYTTLTTPSATVPVLSPSTYQAANNSFSPESGRGFTRLGEIKPDFAAPGVSVTGPGPAGSYVSFSGSSASAAITSGAAALFLQWGIQRTPARYFTAQEVKNYLIRGADRTDTITYPSREWGYGRLQLYQSFTSLMTN